MKSVFVITYSRLFPEFLFAMIEIELFPDFIALLPGRRVSNGSEVDWRRTMIY